MSGLTYVLSDDQGVELKVRARSLRAAEQRARAWAREGDYDAGSTLWVDVSVLRVTRDGRERVSEVTVAIDPVEPRCKGKGSHIYVDDGAKGFGAVVCGNGGGVITRRRCKICGLTATVDTWAQRPDTGEQGLESITYAVAEPDEPDGDQSNGPFTNGDVPAAWGDA